MDTSYNTSRSSSGQGTAPQGTNADTAPGNFISGTGGTPSGFVASCPGCGPNGASDAFSGIIPAPQYSFAGQRLPTLEEIASYNYVNPNRSDASNGMIRPQTSTRQETAITPSSGPGLSQTQMISPDGTTVEGASLQYLNGFIRTQIGRKVRVDFLIGTNTLVDKAGILLGVGANYILLNETETDDLVACDFYNIKFIQFYY